MEPTTDPLISLNVLHFLLFSCYVRYFQTTIVIIVLLKFIFLALEQFFYCYLLFFKLNDVANPNTFFFFYKIKHDCSSTSCGRMINHISSALYFASSCNNKTLQLQQQSLTALIEPEVWCVFWFSFTSKKVALPLWNIGSFVCKLWWLYSDVHTQYGVHLLFSGRLQAFVVYNQRDKSKSRKEKLLKKKQPDFGPILR